MTSFVTANYDNIGNQVVDPNKVLTNISSNAPTMLVQNSKAPMVLFAATDYINPDGTVNSAKLSSDFLAVNGTTPTITVETGPNGKPAIKIVTPVGTAVQVQVKPLIGAMFYGDFFVCHNSSSSLTNLNSHTWYFSSDSNASYTNYLAQAEGRVQPYIQNSPQEQGGTRVTRIAKASWNVSGTLWPVVGGTTQATPSYPFEVFNSKVIITPNAGTSATMWIYGAGFGGPKAKGRICVTWDDGYDSMFRYGYEVFASRGIPQTLAVIGSTQDQGGSTGYSYTRQLQAFINGGNALVAHGPWGTTVGNAGLNNLFTAYTPNNSPLQTPALTANALSDMIKNRQFLADRGLLVPGAYQCYVWPEGVFQYNDNDVSLLDAAISSGFNFGRSAGNSSSACIADARSRYGRMNCPIIGHHYAGTVAAETTNIQNIVNTINSVAANGEDAFIMFHRCLSDTATDAQLISGGSISIRQKDLATIADAIKTNIVNGTMTAATLPQMNNPSWWGSQ